MKHTLIQDNDKTFIPNRTAGYKKVDENFVNWMTNNQLVGHDAVYSSVEDLFLWHRTLERGKLGKYDLEILKVPGKFNDGSSGNYGYGIVSGKYRGLDYYCHDGWYVGYKAFIMTIPDKEFGIILLSNWGNKSVRSVGMKMIEAFFADENFITEDLPSVRENYFNLSAGTKFVRKGLGGFKSLESVNKNYYQSPKSNVLWTADHLNKISLDENMTGFIHHTSYGSSHYYLPFTEVASNKDDMKEFVGQYFSNELQNSAKIDMKENKIYLELGLNTSELVQVFHGEFAADDCMIKIERDNTGKIIGFNYSTYSVRGLIFNKE